MITNSSITLFPTKISGKLEAPPSKSLSHRALICASLAPGKSIISNILLSEDIKATINALKHLGAKFNISNKEIVVTGVNHLKYDNFPIHCNESGSTLRFMIPIFSLTNKKVIFVGEESLIKRPQTIYQQIFNDDGNTFIKTNNKIVVKGSIKSRNYYIDGNVSSQFFSGLMFSLPLLDEDSTIDILEQFGVDIQEIENGYFIPGNQTYKPSNYQVEGDYSQAAFFLVGGIINGAIEISELEYESNQGDKAIINVITNMKGRIVYTENGFVVSKSNTAGTIIDISDCPDLGPIIALLATLSKGTTTITNISRLRLKESDRVKSTVETLRALGANILVKNEKIIIHGKTLLEGGVTVNSQNDHRIAMMVSIAALRCKKEVVLTNANAVNKSYPHFYKDYKHLGGKYKIKD